MLRIGIAIAVFAAGLIAAGDVQAAEDDDIVFARKNFVDVGDEGVAISGTLTGDGVVYKNNTVSISCFKSRRECYVASIRQIGHNQIGRLGYVDILPITKWTADEVVAVEPLDIQCARITIAISRRDQTAIWVQEPANQARAECLLSDNKAHRWAIEDWPGFKKTR